MGFRAGNKTPVLKLRPFPSDPRLLTYIRRAKVHATVTLKDLESEKSEKKSEKFMNTIWFWGFQGFCQIRTVKFSVFKLKLTPKYYHRGDINIRMESPPFIYSINQPNNYFIIFDTSFIGTPLIPAQLRMLGMRGCCQIAFQGLVRSPWFKCMEWFSY